MPIIVLHIRAQNHLLLLKKNTGLKLLYFAVSFNDATALLLDIHIGLISEALMV